MAALRNTQHEIRPQPAATVSGEVTHINHLFAEARPTLQLLVALCYTQPDLLVLIQEIEEWAKMVIAKLKHWLHHRVLTGGALGAATLILFACNTPVLGPTDLNPTQPVHSTSPIEPAPADAVAQPELPQIPSSLELAAEDAVGERLVFSGTVYADDRDTPLANAFITIWHTDAEGEYGQFRGTLQSDSTGVYQFRTIRPGNYQVETTTRAAHIHFNISAVGMQSASGEILFADDPYLETDPVVLEMDPAVDASRVITLTLVEEPAGSYFQGRFDVILKSR